jgi:hypothetical protein
MREDLQEVKKRLGEGGGSKNMARLALEMLGIKKPQDIDEFFANLEF